MYGLEYNENYKEIYLFGKFESNLRIILRIYYFQCRYNVYNTFGLLFE